jgi:hypothetical protein
MPGRCSLTETRWLTRSGSFKSQLREVPAPADEAPARASKAKNQRLSVPPHLDDGPLDWRARPAETPLYESRKGHLG